MFDQETCLLYSRLGLRRSIALDVKESVYKRNLQLDLFVARYRGSRQSRNLIESASELLYSFDQRRALNRPLS